MSYRSVAVPLAILAAGGCAGSLQRSIAAYERGDFRGAHELLARVEPGEGAEVREAVAEAIDYSASYLLSQAWVALERGRGAKPYREALAYYRAALRVMPNDHARRAATLENVAELARNMEKVRARHRTVLARFRAAAGKRDYNGAIPLATELVELLRSVGGDEPDSDEVLALAEQALGDGEHNLAVQLVELADLVRRELRARVAGLDMGEIARVAAALRYFNREAAEMEGETAVVRRAGRRKSARKSAQKAESLRQPELGTAVDEPDAQDPEPERQREATSRLEQARSQWASGDKHEALCILDRAIAVLGADGRLGEQRRRWQPARELLIADYVERAELALSREATAEARGWYERILALDAQHELARDRMRKLDKLLELQSGDR